MPEELADKDARAGEACRSYESEAPQADQPDRRRRPTDEGHRASWLATTLRLWSAISGMLVTAVDVGSATDNALLAPMVEQAEETTGTRVPMTLADAGYFAASHVAECVRRGQQVVVQRFLKDPYHKDRFTYDEHSDSFTCPQGQTPSYTACERSPVATVPGFRRRLSGCPGACPKEIGRSLAIG